MIVMACSYRQFSPFIYLSTLIHRRIDGIVAKGAGAMESDGYIAMLGGIQINTPEDVSDYFLPLTFDLRNSKGELEKSLM